MVTKTISLIIPSELLHVMSLELLNPSTDPEQFLFMFFLFFFTCRLPYLKMRSERLEMIIEKRRWWWHHNLSLLQSFSHRWWWLLSCLLSDFPTGFRVVGFSGTTLSSSSIPTLLLLLLSNVVSSIFLLFSLNISFSVRWRERDTHEVMW